MIKKFKKVDFDFKIKEKGYNCTKYESIFIILQQN